MRPFLTVPLILLLVLLAPKAWGGDGQPPDQVSQRWALLFSDQDLPSGLKEPTAPIFQAALAPTFFIPPIGLTRLRDLSPETERPRTQGLLASTKWLNGTLVTETEVANSLGGTGWLQGKIPGDTRDDTSNRMVRLSLTGTSGTVRYGMTNRTSGQAFFNGPDQAMREVWGEWKSDWTTIRTAVGQLWNNVAGDSTRSRMEQAYGRVGLAWNRPAWPDLNLTYTNSSLSSALEPLGVTPQRLHNHSLEAALAYNSMRWNARVASSYILGNDLLRNGAATNVKMQMSTASFRPLNTLTIAPTVTYREELQEWSGVRINSPAATLALHYEQSQQLLFSATGNYTSMRSSDRLIDTENVGGKGILAWSLQQSQAWATMIAFEAGYNRLTNRVTPSADTEDISGLVRFVLAAS